MQGKLFLMFVGAMIGGMIFSKIKVDAQSTVDDSAPCESSTMVEAVNLIREDLKDMRNLLGSHQEDLKAACTSNQQQCSQTELSTQAVPSSLLSEYITRVTCFR